MFVFNKYTADPRGMYRIQFDVPCLCLPAFSSALLRTMAHNSYFSPLFLFMRKGRRQPFERKNRLAQRAHSEGRRTVLVNLGGLLLSNGQYFLPFLSPHHVEHRATFLLDTFTLFGYPPLCSDKFASLDSLPHFHLPQAHLLECLAVPKFGRIVRIRGEPRARFSASTALYPARTVETFIPPGMRRHMRKSGFGWVDCVSLATPLVLVSNDKSSPAQINQTKVPPEATALTPSNMGSRRGSCHLKPP